jgi:hypothetical protein
MAPVTSLNSQQLVSYHFPLLDAPPPASAGDAYGNPANVYSVPLTAAANGQGVYAAIDSYGIGGHLGQSNVYYVTKNSDGTWSSPHFMWSGGGQYTGWANPALASIIGVNALGEVLGTGESQRYPGGGIGDTYLFNIKTGNLLNLDTLPIWTSAKGWSVDPTPLAIDNQGRILLEAQYGLGIAPGPAHLILLTPDGVSSDPVAAPEPGALALTVVTLAALALRRALRSRA